MNTTDYDKLFRTLRTRLQAKGAHDPRFYEVVAALNFFQSLHAEELRKDGVTKGFYHQLNMLAFAMSFEACLPDAPSVYITILGHDSVEDYRKQAAAIAMQLSAPDFALIEGMSKIDQNERKMTNAVYYERLKSNPILSVVKMIDRLHNLSTMLGVFAPHKVMDYCDETRKFVLPMAKHARQAFPQYEPVLVMLKQVIELLLASADRVVEMMDKVATNADSTA